MLEIHHETVRNRLLRTLSEDDFNLLTPHLSRDCLDLGHTLGRPGRPIECVYFPESGLASITSSTNPSKIEIGLVGREGLVGIPLLLGAVSSPNDTFIQMAGSFLKIEAPAFLDLLDRSPPTKALFLRFVHVFMIQLSQTVAANASLAVEGRLARWLLLCHDRADGDDLNLTHEFLAMMLGVRRPGVTVATHVLEGNGIIRARRGRITVLSREKLEELADDAYGSAEAEYVRLIGPLR